MPDRWTAWCRARVPAPLRETAFDPSLADLECDWAVRTDGGPSRLHRAAAVARLVWQCRRLGAGAPLRRRPSWAAAGRRPFERTSMPLRDLRLATRRLARQPVFAMTTGLTLALGIGANLTIFAFVHALLLAPINAPEPDRLVRVAETLRGGRITPILSWLDYVDLRDGATTVELAAHGQATSQVGRAGAIELRSVELVSGNYFRVLGQTPLVGRFIDDADNRGELASPVVVLSEPYWRTRHAARPDVVGDTLLINGAAFRIVGIAPAGFRGTFHAHPVDLWAPVAMQQQVRPRGQTLENRGWGWLRVVGRLRPDASVDAARAELDVIAADRNRRFPRQAAADAFAVAATPASALTDDDSRTLAPVVAVTFGFTLVLFLVTCANLTGVMQARLLTRAREIAVRQALGAGRSRAMSEWAAECLLLATAGGAAGLLFARVAVAAISRLRPPQQLVGDMSVMAGLDWRMAVYGLALSVVAGVLFGLIPAARIGRGGLSPTLKDGAATASASRPAVAMRRAAVVFQLALSGVLLVASALLGASLVNRQAFDPGFETGTLGLLWVDLERQRVPDTDWRRLGDLALERARLDGAVRAADLGFAVPLGFGEDVLGFRIPGYTPPDGRGYVSINFNVVGARYFSTLGVPFVGGATWMPSTTGEPSIVINETMGQRFWPDRNPVGQIIELVGVAPVRVSGVVRDTSYYQIGEEPIPYVYLPAERRMPGRFVLHVRTDGDPTPVIGRLRRALEAADPRLTPYEAMTFEELRRAPLFPARLLVVTGTIFGGLAVLLAGIGLYGVMAMSVSERTREIGVRMALGAGPGQVVAGVFREAIAVSLIGLAIACVAGYLTAGVLSGWLFGIGAFDPVLYGAAGLFLLSVAALAAWIPARRAARIDPVVALRV